MSLRALTETKPGSESYGSIQASVTENAPNKNMAFYCRNAGTPSILMDWKTTPMFRSQQYDSRWNHFELILLKKGISSRDLQPTWLRMRSTQSRCIATSYVQVVYIAHTHRFPNYNHMSKTALPSCSITLYAGASKQQIIYIFQQIIWPFTKQFEKS